MSTTQPTDPTPTPTPAGPTRPPSYAPTAPPPRYQAVIARVYPYSLRPILILTSILGAIYAFVMTANAIKNISGNGLSTTLQTINIPLAAMYGFVGVVELYGLIVALLQSRAMGKALLGLAPAGILLMFVGQLMNVIVHFTNKSDLINRCVQQTQGTGYVNSNGDNAIITAAQAASICDTNWSNGNWTVIAWLIVTTVLSFLFGSVAISYYRQLVNPSLVRTRQGWFRQEVQPVQAYQMQPGQQFYPPPPPPQNNSWMVPPYPGPPAGNGGFEKSDYQPSAEWAQQPLSYAPPPGAPGAQGAAGFGGGAHREEEEAWHRAEREGVTAHLTGNASSATRARNEDRGYVVHNDEEDEAWERARQDGVTAHLTGQPKKNDGQV